MIPLAQDVAVYVSHLRSVGFVRDVDVAWEPKAGPRHIDALVTLETPRRLFKVALQIKRTFLDRSATNAVVAERLRLERDHRLPLLLAARYIPRPTGERLAGAGVNFVDRLGNVHLKLGDAYEVLLLGRRGPRTPPGLRRVGPAWVKILFLLLADPASARWTVRELADAAGVGRTAAAEARQRLLGDGLLRLDRDGHYQITSPAELADDFVDGYNRILRPHLLIGRFRAGEREPERLLEQFGLAARRLGLQWALTGTPAAHALQRFYRSEQVPIFVTDWPVELQRELKLLPDSDGPLTVLRAFGDRYAWRTMDRLTIAHPWLIYAELIREGEPRALEAANHLREEFLPR